MTQFIKLQQNYMCQHSTGPSLVSCARHGGGGGGGGGGGRETVSLLKISECLIYYAEQRCHRRFKINFHGLDPKL